MARRTTGKLLTPKKRKRVVRSVASFWAKCFLLGVESQAVIGLRLAKLAWGDAAARTEAHRMVAEKVKAAIDVQQKAGTALILGKAPVSPSGVVGIYRRRVRRNRQRLLRKK